MNYHEEEKSYDMKRFRINKKHDTCGHHKDDWHKDKDDCHKDKDDWRKDKDDCA